MYLYKRYQTHELFAFQIIWFWKVQFALVCWQQIREKIRSFSCFVLNKLAVFFYLLIVHIRWFRLFSKRSCLFELDIYGQKPLLTWGGWNKFLEFHLCDLSYTQCSNKRQIPTKILTLQIPDARETFEVCTPSSTNQKYRTSVARP